MCLAASCICVYIFLQEIIEERKQNAVSGFRAAGIWPLSRPAMRVRLHKFQEGVVAGVGPALGEFFLRDVIVGVKVFEDIVVIEESDHGAGPSSSRPQFFEVLHAGVTFDMRFELMSVAGNRPYSKLRQAWRAGRVGSRSVPRRFLSLRDNGSRGRS